MKRAAWPFDTAFFPGKDARLLADCRPCWRRVFPTPPAPPQLLSMSCSPGAACVEAADVLLR